MSLNNYQIKISIDQGKRVDALELLSDIEKDIKRLFFNHPLVINGRKVRLSTSKTGNGGLRRWFACPICQERCKWLYPHPSASIIGCKDCIPLSG